MIIRNNRIALYPVGVLLGTKTPGMFSVPKNSNKNLKTVASEYTNGANKISKT